MVNVNDEQALHWPWLSLAISKVHEPVQATLCPWSIYLSMPAFVAEPVVALEAAESAQVRASCAKKLVVRTAHRLAEPIGSYKVQKHQNLMFASTAGNKMHKNKFKNTSKNERKARPQKHKG